MQASKTHIIAPFQYGTIRPRWARLRGMAVCALLFFTAFVAAAFLARWEELLTPLALSCVAAFVLSIFIPLGLFHEHLNERMRYLSRAGELNPAQRTEVRPSLWRLLRRHGNVFRVTYEFSDRGGISRRVTGLYKGLESLIPGTAYVIHDPNDPRVSLCLLYALEDYAWVQHA